MKNAAPRQAAGGAQARPAQSRPTAAQRPQSAAVARLQGSTQRPAGPAQRGYAASGASARAPQQGTARPAAGQARPAQNRPGVQARPQGTRPSGGAAAQRRPAVNPSASGARTARSTRPANGAQKKPVSRSGYGYSGPAGGRGGRMNPAIQAICLVLITVMLMAASVAIAAKIRSNQPRPVIVMNTTAPITQTSEQLASNVTNDPAPTGVPAVAATDAPITPTDVPVQATDVPVQATDVPVSPTDAPVVPSGNRTATIRTIGDVIIDQTTLDNCETGNEVFDFSPLFELVGDVMSDADWTMINIEATLCRHKKYGYMGYPQFFTPRSILQDLKEVGVDMLTMCNNHALDGWYDGLKLSLDYADEAGFAHVGAYRTQEEHDTPEIYNINGIRVGMVNYTQYTNSMESQCDPEATIYGMRLMRKADYEGDIADLKNAGAEFTIAIMHWGTEYLREPDDDIKSIARRLVAAGADLVIGGHPHVVQPAEYITATQADGTQNTALVIYSLGNFYSEHRHNKKAYTDNGVIFEFTLSDDGNGGIEMSSPAFIPVYMWHTEGAGAYEFRAVPSGVYLDNPPAGMSSGEYSRMKESYQEIVDLIGGVIEIKAD